MGKINVRKVDSTQLDSGLVECPDCCGTGWWVEEGLVESDATMCLTCKGKGKITQHDYEQWERNIVDVYEAQRNYVRMQTAD